MNHTPDPPSTATRGCARFHYLRAGFPQLIGLCPPGYRPRQARLGVRGDDRLERGAENPSREGHSHMQEPEEPMRGNDPTVAEPTVYVVDDDPAMRSSLRWL